jgi:uncharacterized membrane protein (DUF485 family)
MFNLEFFRQKSPQQRFLFILGVTMMVLYVAIAVVVIFFGELIHLDPEKFPQKYRIAFGVVLMIYAMIRFSRLFITHKEND